jgi:hypothetical protein
MANLPMCDELVLASLRRLGDEGAYITDPQIKYY